MVCSVTASRGLLVNLVSSTILQLVLEPPGDVSRWALLDELARWMEDRITVGVQQ